MSKLELYKQLLEKQAVNKKEATLFIDERIGKAVDKTQMIESLWSNINSIKTLCDDLLLELRLHESHPAVSINKKKFYTTKEAAEILDLSASKIRELVKAGKLAHKEISLRDWKIYAWSLDAYANGLSNFLAYNSDSESGIEVVDVIDDENQIILSFLTELGIHKLSEYQTRIKRKIAKILPGLKG